MNSGVSYEHYVVLPLGWFLVTKIIIIINFLTKGKKMWGFLLRKNNFSVLNPLLNSY